MKIQMLVVALLLLAGGKISAQLATVGSPESELTYSQEAVLQLLGSDYAACTVSEEVNVLGNRSFSILEQSINDIPVLGARAIAFVDEQGLVSYVINYLRPELVQLNWNLSKSSDQVLSAGLVHFQTLYPNAELVQYVQSASPVIVPDMEGNYKLGWKYLVQTASNFSDVHSWFLADADLTVLRQEEGHSACEDPTIGEGTTQFFGSQLLHCDHVGDGYRLHGCIESQGDVEILTYDGTNGSTWADVSENAEVYTDDNNIWGEISDEETGDVLGKRAIGAHWATAEAHRYFFEAHGLEASNGTPISVYANDNSAAGAFAGTHFFRLGNTANGRNFALDVVGHEFGHVFQANFAPMWSQLEPRAVKESFADISGVLVEAFIGLGSTPWVQGDIEAIRNLANPNEFGQPDTYEGLFWLDWGISGAAESYVNMGIGNFWFYLLTEGGNGTNDNGDYYEVQGIGMQDAARIWVQTMLSMSQFSGFHDWKVASLAAAESLFGPCSDQYISTCNAWHAVGLGSPYGNGLPPTGIEASTLNCGAALVWDDMCYAQYLVEVFNPDGTLLYAVYTSDPEVYLGGLVPLTSYSVNVYGSCSGDAFTPPSEVGIETTESCPTITGLEVVEVGFCNASLQWEDTGAVSYVVTVTDALGASFEVSTEDPFVELVELDSSQAFTCEVVADCGGCLGESASVSFNTYNVPDASDLTLQFSQCGWLLSYGATTFSDEVFVTATISEGGFPVAFGADLYGLDLQGQHGIDEGAVVQLVLTLNGATEQCAFTESIGPIDFTVDFEEPECQISGGVSATIHAGPTFFTPFDYENWSCVFEWEPVLGATSYAFEFAYDTPPTWVAGGSVTSAWVNTFDLISAPTNGMDLHFRVQPTCGCDGVTEVGTWQQVTASAPCLSSEILEITKVCPTEVAVIAERVFGTALQDYVLEFSTDGGASWFAPTQTLDPILLIPASSVSFHEMEITASGLLPGETYLMRVRNTCFNGEENFSAEISIALPSDCPDPAGVLIENNVESLALTWDDPGVPVNGYIVSYQIGGDPEWLEFFVGSNSAQIELSDVFGPITAIEIQTVCGCSSSGVTAINDIPYQCGASSFDNEWQEVLQLDAGWTDNLSDATSLLTAGLIFSSGGIYVIDDAVLEMGPGAEIIVEQGATVVLNNCDIYSCDQWEGIRVVSDNGTPGLLELNGCRLIHARVALSTYDASPLYQDVLNDEGDFVFQAPVDGEVTAGSVSAVNTLFYNNLTSIYWSEDVDESSSVEFTDCEFIVDDWLYEVYNPLILSDRFEHHVQLTHVIGLDFLGCAFRNQMETVFPGSWESRGAAISTLNAKYEVNESAQAVSSFRGFERAIHSANTTAPWNHLRVLNSTFRDNQIAMHFNDVCWHDVIQNTIDVGPSLALPVELQEADVPYEGIFQQMGAFFIIAENVITGVGSPAGINPFVGIRVRDTGANDNEVYQNFLTNLTRGCQAEGDNVGSTAPWEEYGLRFVCNEFTDCVFDLINANNGLATEVSLEQFGLAHDDEGMPVSFDPTSPLAGQVILAGNSFTTTSFAGLSPTGQWHNEGSLIDYWCGEESECPENALDVLPFFPTSTNPENSCPSVPVEVVGGLQEEYMHVPTDWIQVENDWEDVVGDHEYLLHALIDGGNTEDLQEEVEFAWIDDTWLMREELLSKSPFLSRDVLRRVADNTVTFPHAVAFEIFVANPDVLRDARFMSHLETKVDPLPGYLLDLLYMSRDQATMRTTIERNLAIASASLQRVRSWSNRIYLADLDQGVTEIDARSEDDQLFDLKLKTHGLMLSGYRNEALSLAESGRRLRLAESDALHLESWIDYLQVGVSSEDWKDPSKLSVSERVALEYLAVNASRTWGGQTAAALLSRQGVVSYYLPPSPLDLQARSHFGREERAVSSSLVLSPNPTSDQVRVELPVTWVQAGTVTLAVYDVNHRLVHVQDLSPHQTLVSLDTTTWPSGMYLLQARSARETLNARLEVIH